MSRGDAYGSGQVNEEVERLKLDCQHELNQMRLAALTPNIKAMEERAQRVLALTRKPGMPVDVNMGALKELKELELLGYQKATDHALRKSMAYGLEGKNAEKLRAIAVARSFFAKALSRGASDEFKKATEMTLESAELTGEVKAQENRAKQKDEVAAPTVMRAKNEQRGAKRFNDPVLAVTVASATFQTVNWSISGMLLADCVHPEIEAGQEHQISVFAPQRPPITIPIRIIRVDPDKRMTSLAYFDESPPEVWAFFKKLILSKQPSAASA
ncbi:MAG TPA: hypothetical protein VMB81_14720 [Candidatus Sulfotelmatobacter sp.]|nr:hypothetical protein [Candidatus Sulfotelmatobacter sp.]